MSFAVLSLNILKSCFEFVWQFSIWTVNRWNLVSTYYVVLAVHLHEKTVMTKLLVIKQTSYTPYCDVTIPPGAYTNANRNL